MIRLQRDGKYSMKLEFDISGANELEKVFDSAIKNSELVVEIEHDSNIKKGKNQKKLKVILNNHENKIHRILETVVLEINIMDLEYGIDKLRECAKGEDFYPAEFCEVAYDNSTVSMYGFLLK